VSGRRRSPAPPSDKPEGWESLAEEASAGSLAPSEELEEALREAAEAVDERQARRKRAPAEAPEDPGQALEELRRELERQRELTLRLQADFDNHRKRVLRERQEAHQYGHENVVKDLLGTVDNLERAIGHARASDGRDFEGMLQGVELVLRELLGVLAKHGVSVVEAEGEPFDPNVHEAMAQVVADEVPAGTVVEVLQKGYRLRDRLLRPARVVVSKPSAAEDPAADS